VKKNPSAHECFSTRRKKKVKNATKHWVRAKVKDWLIDDGNLTARSQFSTIFKVDYVTNNLAECFNSWIKHYK
jgi:hypothetical protein